MAIAGLLFTIICIIIPIRTLVYYCFDKGEGEDGQEYRSQCLLFPTDYDKENPLTSNEGKLRLLGYQLKDAEKAGNSDMIEALKAQLE